VPKQFDASTKFLVEMYPEDWIAFLDLPRGNTHIEEADVSTITAAGDKIVQVDAAIETYGVHFEFQAGVDYDFLSRLWKYNVLYTVKLGFLVRSVAVLLRPFDGHRTITGRYLRQSVTGVPVHDFHYQVVRVWQMPPEVFLEGGLALLPLAAVAKVNKRNVANVVRQIEERLEQHTKPVEGELLRTATSVLLGLKYDKAFVEKIMGKNVLELSSVYQAARQEGLDEGREEGREEGKLAGIREMLIRTGRRRLGEPNAATRAFLESITDIETLEGFADRLWDIESWEELQAG
jgi:hypothetical protein